MSEAAVTREPSAGPPESSHKSFVGVAGSI
jgi:hypothetical protein